MCRLLIIVITFLLSFVSFSQNQFFEYEQTNSFFPEWKELEGESIDWGTLRVPEDWNDPNGKSIELAIAKLNSFQEKPDSDPVIFIQGGPGGSSINGLWRWLKHPLRKQSDIILIDLRGTGFSQPSLCPDLGNTFLKILAKNQTKEEDEKDKVDAALECRTDLVQRGINLSAYNSSSISKDLNALRKALKIKKWIVYGVSYGTYVSQIYASNYSQNVSSIILDSPISEISNYVDENTVNYINSLNLLFEKCKDNNICDKEYPNLEKIYYETIEQLENNPITVNVDNRVISSGQFTYNVEDFKIAIQQSLYQKNLIEVLPLLIYEFHRGNKGVLSNLVAAFSGALGLDYGTYYCVTCNEVIPKNSLLKFDSITKNYPKLKGGLSFYKADFKVCEKWSRNMIFDTIKVNWNNLNNIPMLLFSGDFDPITPSNNAKEIADLSKNEILSQMPTYGHGSSFSDFGNKIVKEFVLNPEGVKISENMLNKNIIFIKDITLNSGVARFAEILNKPDLIFLSPFCIALIVLLITSLSYLFSMIKNYKNLNFHIKILYGIVILASSSGIGFIAILIFSILSTANSNFYIIAFGLPNEYSYLFVLCYLSVVLFILYLFIFLLKIKIFPNKNIYYIELFSLFLMNFYFYYWGFI